MLLKLDISNYALIENLNLTFYQGFSAITGETGAGKSILLKALNLLLGERADYSVLKQNDKKCILEAEFDVSNFISPSFFEEIGVDYDKHTIIRREFTTLGKSRMFINDTPVNLNTLKTFGEKLVKIHTQHQTLELFEKNFQMEVLDSFSNLKTQVEAYKTNYKTFLELKLKLSQLKLKEAKNRKEKDYLTYLIEELIRADLDQINVTQLQSEYNKIQNWSVVKENLQNAQGIFEDANISPIQNIDLILTTLNPLKDIDNTYNELILRLNSTKIELQDIVSEIENLSDIDDLDEEKALEIQEKIEVINALSYKHNVDSIEELLTLKQEFEQQINEFSSVESEITITEQKLNNTVDILHQIAKELNIKRKQNCIKLEKEVKALLTELSMPNAELKINLTTQTELNHLGLNTIDFLFKTNKGGEFLSIKKTASGGELSRLMLSILTIIAKTKALPTLIFDEIDTGVSGEVASKMANIFEKLSQTSQLIVITHLPQVAGKSKYHYHVYKQDTKDKTNTQVVLLNYEKRIKELAKMISGEQLTDLAIENAKQLIQ
ncbi:MAG TPA: DNA repair protein RecN [Crocinitomix sp.]|nr:DNA repair protein RecN [Crocinitomix sp.]